MFKIGTRVKTTGTFTVKESNDEYVEMDSWEKGTEDSLTQYEAAGFTEINEDGIAKNFDGFQRGDFFKFDADYPVIESNEVFTKIEIEGQALYFPNHKLQEVV